jgi:hypothetical protein
MNPMKHNDNKNISRQRRSWSNGILCATLYYTFKKMAKDMEIDADAYDLKIQQVNAIAHPLASKKLTKKVVKTIKKGRPF